jgi:hypothetical protein
MAKIIMTLHLNIPVDLKNVSKNGRDQQNKKNIQEYSFALF